MGFFDHLLRDIRSVVDRDGVQDAIPPLDGALSPNDRLDACTPIGDPLPGLDDVIVAKDGSVYVSAGRKVIKLAGNGLVERSLVAEFEGDAGGLAIHPDGRLLVCVAGRGLAALDPGSSNPRWLESADGRGFAGLTSVTAAPDGRIFMVEGSTGRAPNQWRHDLMEKRSNGRLVVGRRTRHGWRCTDRHSAVRDAAGPAGGSRRRRGLAWLLVRSGGECRRRYR